MTFFYDLNKRLAQLADKQDAEHLAEHSAPAAQPKSKLAQALNERDLGKHNNATTGFAALAKKTGGGEKGARIAGAQLAKMRAKGQVEESHCSACNCSPCECNSMEESAFQAAIGKKKYGEKGMNAVLHKIGNKQQYRFNKPHRLFNDNPLPKIIKKDYKKAIITLAKGNSINLFSEN
jgi:hypothetical protein